MNIFGTSGVFYGMTGGVASSIATCYLLCEIYVGQLDAVEHVSYGSRTAQRTPGDFSDRFFDIANVSLYLLPDLTSEVKFIVITPTELRTINWIPVSQEDRAMVIDQLERILISPLFKQSKRYSPFLRYVVEKTLSGEEDTLKERTIGVEVFGRDPLYDSNNDPIVRVTSGEVRRRIAQYYHEAGHEQELRIDLSPGSYVPEFIPSTKPRQTGVTAAMTPESLPDNSLESSTKLIQPLLGLVALVALLVFAVRWQTQHHTAVERWWKPAFHSSSPVLLSVGMLKAPASSSSEIQDVGKATQTPPDLVGLVDAVALERLAYLLSTHQQAYRTLSSVHTTYNDLRGGPAVLVAGLNNPWTLRITDPLRFHFEIIPETRTARIVDRQHPENTAWQWDFSQPHSQTQDYAIVARLHDATSEEPVFIAAGLGSSGTAAAAELLTSPSSLLELVSHLPSHWENRNIEAVIQTQVIDGQAGPPKLVSVEVW